MRMVVVDEKVVLISNLETVIATYCRLTLNHHHHDLKVIRTGRRLPFFAVDCVRIMQQTSQIRG